MGSNKLSEYIELADQWRSVSEQDFARRETSEIFGRMSELSARIYYLVCDLRADEANRLVGDYSELLSELSEECGLDG